MIGFFLWGEKWFFYNYVVVPDYSLWLSIKTVVLSF